MRKYILILLSVLTPLGVWSSGCQQEVSRGRMPKGPEMERLARAPGSTVDDAMAKAPVIPAMIDPEIINAPDQPTFARIQAVMDREATIASNFSDPGLFVLPRQEYPDMAIVPQTVPPVTPEFWSSPAEQVRYMPSGKVNLSPELEGDLSAMAPAANPNTYYHQAPAAPITHAPLLEAYPSYTMPPAIAAPDAHGLTPLVPMPATTTPIAQTPPALNGDITAFDVPGLFFGPDDIMLAVLDKLKPLDMKTPEPKPDLFADKDLGMLAQVDDLEGLTTLLVDKNPSPTTPVAQTAAPWGDAPVVADSSTESADKPELAPGLLDFSLLNFNEPQNQAPVAVAPAPIAARAPTPVADTTLAAILPPPLPEPSELPELADSLVGEPLPTGETSDMDMSWDAFKPPVKLDRQTPTLDPLIDYDFSAFAKKEEKAAAQRIKLTPSDPSAPASPKKPPAALEPEAPPIL